MALVGVFGREPKSEGEVFVLAAIGRGSGCSGRGLSTPGDKAVGVLRRIPESKE